VTDLAARIDHLARLGCRVVVTADELYPPHTTFSAVVYAPDATWRASSKRPSEALEHAIACALRVLPTR